MHSGTFTIEKSTEVEGDLEASSRGMGMETEYLESDWEP